MAKHTGLSYRIQLHWVIHHEKLFSVKQSEKTSEKKRVTMKEKIITICTYTKGIPQCGNHTVRYNERMCYTENDEKEVDLRRYMSWVRRRKTDVQGKRRRVRGYFGISTLMHTRDSRASQSKTVDVQTQHQNHTKRNDTIENIGPGLKKRLGRIVAEQLLRSQARVILSHTVGDSLVWWCHSQLPWRIESVWYPSHRWNECRSASFPTDLAIRSG